MSKTFRTLIIASTVFALFTACSSSNKKTETAADSSSSSASNTNTLAPSPKLTGLAKWQVKVPNQFSGARWSSFADKYPTANLEIKPGDNFTDQIKTLLNGESFNLNEYICTKSDAKAAGKINYQIVTCVIPMYAEYSYFINIIDTVTKVNRIYEIKELGVNTYLGKERDSEPERVYEYDISEVETQIPFMDTTAILLKLDRKYSVSSAIEDGADVKTDYHTYENYIFAGNDMRLITHWSAKHSQSISDWMACDRSNPDPKLCPSTQTQQTCSQAVFDGKTWSSSKGDCL